MCLQISPALCCKLTAGVRASTEKTRQRLICNSCSDLKSVLPSRRQHAKQAFAQAVACPSWKLVSYMSCIILMPHTDTHTVHWTISRVRQNHPVAPAMVNGKCEQNFFLSLIIATSHTTAHYNDASSPAQSGRQC